MATIYNTDLTKAIAREAGVQTARDNIPSQIAEKVVPVIDVTPRQNRVCDIVRLGACSNATSATIYTTPADRDFYLVGASISVIKDITSTSTTSNLRVTINGVAQSLLSISTATLTIQTAQNSISLPVPIKCDRNSTITLTSDTNVANFKIQGTIIGYVVDTAL